jgi:hypothetical protein
MTTRTATILVLRGALTSILVLLAAFCCFGFAASAEAGPRGAIAFRLLYGITAVAGVAAVAAVWRVKTRMGWALTSILVLFSAFCCFMYFASAETWPTMANAFHLLYGTAVVACVVAVVSVWLFVKTRRGGASAKT